MVTRAGKIATILTVGPAALLIAGLGGIVGAWLALRLMSLAPENFFIGPFLWLALAIGGFAIGGAITLALSVLIALPVARRRGWGSDANVR